MQCNTKTELNNRGVRSYCGYRNLDRKVTENAGTITEMGTGVIYMDRKNSILILIGVAS